MKWSCKVSRKKLLSNQLTLMNSDTNNFSEGTLPGTYVILK